MKIIKINCKVHTRKREEKIFFDENGLLHIHITQVPEKGKANKKIIEIVADFYGVPKYTIFIMNGFTTTLKTIEIRMNGF